MNADIKVTSKDYVIWLAELKRKIRSVQIKATVKVNTELLNFYWELSAEIVDKQTNASWGDGFLHQLSKDLVSEFPEMKGFSLSNLKYMRQWYLFYNQNEIIGQQAVGLIVKIPWGHNIAIMSRCKTIDEALYYVQNTMIHNWSRSVLVHQIDSGLRQREGKSLNNFTASLPKPQSDLAGQTLKDPYVFDFLVMAKDYNERDLEKGLVNHITHFLLELGAGFAYIQPTIGILLCKSKDKMVAEYALSDIHKPIGISEYQFTQSLPDNLKPSLPSIEEIEKELEGDWL